MTTATRLTDVRRALETRLVPLAWANLIANIGIVVTGGAVRLTGSGLGCPTWPKCTEDSLTTHGALGIHGVIEFGNRLLTYVLLVIAVAFVVAAWRRTDRVRALGFVILAGIPAQAVVGGITVLTDLNPWIVSAHLLVSMAIVGVCVVVLDDLTGPSRPEASAASYRLAVATFAAGWFVLWLGTVVTGSGPHSGDLDSRRTGLNPEIVSHIHGISVGVLLALTIGLAVSSRRRGESALALFATGLVAVELAQGLLGYVQFFTDLPEILVGTHMLGAGLVAAGLARVLVTTQLRD